MDDANVPPDVGDFLAAHTPLIAHLEALLLLRAERDAAWTSERMAARLFISPRLAAEVLAHFERHGFVEVDAEKSYHYAPSTPALAGEVDRAAETYRTRLVAVTRFIHARQSSGLQLFADAFRLRKD